MARFCSGGVGGGVRLERAPGVQRRCPRASACALACRWRLACPGREVLCRVSQRARQFRRLHDQSRRPDRSPGARRGLGEGHPQGRDRHDAAGRHAAPRRRGARGRSSRALETTLDRAAARQRPTLAGRSCTGSIAPNTPTPSAICCALEVDVTSLLPPDDSSAGFDNIADVLGVSPVLLESYLTAAERISALAVGDPSTPPTGEVFRVRQDASQDRHIEGLPLGTVGGLLVEHDAAARRRVSVPGARCSAPTSARCAASSIRTSSRSRVDGERVHIASFGGDQEIAASSDNPTTTGDEVDDALHRARAAQGRPAPDWRRLPAEDARAATRAACSRTCAAPRTRSTSPACPHIDEVMLTGPFNPTGPGDTPSRRRIFVCRPDEPGATRPRARSRSSRPWRGAPIAATSPPADVQVLLDFFRQRPRGRRHLRSAASTWRCAGSSASPKFIFRVERDPAGVAAGAAYRLSRPRARVAAVVLPVEQHSRRRAARPRRRRGGCGRRRVARAAGAPDARRPEVGGAASTTSLGQWLHLRNLRGKQPNSHEFPDFDDNLRAALQTEIGAVLQLASSARIAACST